MSGNRHKTGARIADLQPADDPSLRDIPHPQHGQLDQLIAELADQPDDCAPKDREMPDNANSLCKWDYRLNEIASIR